MGDGLAHLSHFTGGKTEVHGRVVACARLHSETKKLRLGLYLESFLTTVGNGGRSVNVCGINGCITASWPSEKCLPREL